MITVQEELSIMELEERAYGRAKEILELMREREIDMDAFSEWLADELEKRGIVWLDEILEVIEKDTEEYIIDNTPVDAEDYAEELLETYGIEKDLKGIKYPCMLGDIIK